MTHEQAVKRQAVERYLLDELSPVERSEFEEHYFDCTECAAEVEAAAVFAANARAVFSEEAGRPAPVHSWWPEWLRPAYALGAVAAVLLLLVAYDEFLRIPGLKRELAQISAPRAYPAFFLKPVARGDEQVLVAPKTATLIGLNLDIPPGGAYSVYECEIRRGAGDPGFSIPVAAPAPPGSPLNVLIPMSRLRPGPYTLTLRGGNTGPAAPELSRFGFTIELN
jgi:hypothetical protein